MGWGGQASPGLSKEGDWSSSQKGDPWGEAALWGSQVSFTHSQLHLVSRAALASHSM